MSAYDIALVLTLVALVGHLCRRAWQIMHIRRNDRRWFHAFWMWPVLWFGLENLIPSWRCRPVLFHGAEIALAVGTLVDFVYYYGLKSERVKQQIKSGLWLVPCLLIWFRGAWLPGENLLLAPPHYGRALVWTDRPLVPKTYYFMAPATRGNAIGDGVQDPNYGRAAFAPMAGVVSPAKENGYLLIRDEKTGNAVEIGPFLEKTLQVQPGESVTLHQPLGLTAHSQKVPGIRLRILRGHFARFRESFAGRRFAFRHEKAFLKRNQYVAYDAPARFRLGE